MKELKYTPENITHLEKGEVFVFGSNLAGNHAGGAARVARKMFGAVMGQGVGLQGQSYAIPTMQGGVETIKPYVEQFITFAREHHNTTFYVTRIGCGIAGFRDEDIAPLFEEALDLYNVRLPKSFVEVIFRNRERRIEATLTPWPVRNYGVYNLLVDLMLANDALLNERGERGLGGRIELLKSSVLSVRRRDLQLFYPDGRLSDYLTEHKNDIITGTNEKMILSVIGRHCDINRIDPVSAAIMRYLVAQIYTLAYLMLRTYDFSKRRAFGFSSYANFEYVLFGTLTGRWNCGDNSYVYENMETCLTFFSDELNHHSDEITSDGRFDKDKFLNFVSQPYIWRYCHEHDGHALHEITLLDSLLNQMESYGEYRLAGNFLVPVNDFSRPVFDLEKGRVSFPSFFIKERFIKAMLAKTENETVWKDN